MSSSPRDLFAPLIACCVCLGAATAASAEEPKFEYAKPEEVTGVEWKAQSKAGMVLATGNSQSFAVTAGLTGSRKSKDNRFSAEGSVAYLRSSLLVAADTNGDGLIGEGEIDRIAQTTSQSWLVRGRYDRFFAEANSVFLSASANSDVPAGKELVGGGQVGYARRLYKVERSETTIEAGYDFVYEEYSAVPDAASIHSARVALLNTSQLGEKSALTVSIEGLINLNTERAPNPDGGNTVPPLQDLRTNIAATLTSPLTDKLSLGLSVKVRIDRVPAPRPPFALPYAPGFLPFADSLDTIAEASLMYTLL